MICVESGRLIRGDIDEKIKRWEVWFMTPFGTCKSMHEAVELLKKHEINPAMAISAVPVAISDSTHEVWAR